ncbi:MAG: hypothetical protein KF849_07455 [Rhizobiaceae bacterium]|nr:hypothetical protein [Rhizobiaceae bacterium]
MTVVVSALGFLLVVVQATFPGAPQSALDALTVLVNRVFPTLPEEKPIELPAPPSKAEYEEAGLELEEPGNGPTDKGGVLEFPFYPAFDDGYAYFEVGNDGKVTDQGRLGLPNELMPLPDFLALSKGTVLRAYGHVRVRIEPAAGTRKIDTIRAGECVSVVDGAQRQNAIRTKTARSGGWLRVAHSECPVVASASAVLRR